MTARGILEEETSGGREGQWRTRGRGKVQRSIERRAVHDETAECLYEEKDQGVGCKGRKEKEGRMSTHEFHEADDLRRSPRNVLAV